MSQPKRRIPLAMAMLYGANPGLAKDQEIARLRAENERLRKAGDAMAHNAHKLGVDAWLTMAKSVVEWKNRKGVQP